MVAPMDLDLGGGRFSELLGGLGTEVRDALAEASGRVEVASGAVLLAEGEPADAAYLVVSGRLVVSVGGRVVGELSRGDVFGEMALLADEPRAATVTAARASTVTRIDGAAFSGLLASHPELHRHLSGQLVQRLRRANSGATESRGRARVIAVVSDGSDAAIAVLDELIGALAGQGQRAVKLVLPNCSVDGASVTVAEVDHDVVLLAPPPGSAAAVAAACDHADAVLAVVDGGASPSALHRLALPASPPRTELVLAHQPCVGCPRGTRTWLDQLRPAAHHHVRLGDRATFDRLARRLTGRPIALVLSGGGARGLAHVGTFRALWEAGVQPDVIAGVSAGAVFAVAIARGWSPEEVEAAARRLMVDGGSPVDATLPTVALASGRKLTARIQDAFADGGLCLEDLWAPTMIVSANLTTADVQQHHHGLAWRAVRASVAIPGVFPPLAEPEGLLVDGGLVDNLPVGRLRAWQPGAFVIASDVGRRAEFPTEGFPTDGEVSGWSALRLRRRTRRGGGRVPGLVALLGRLSALGGAGVAASPGDLHIDHELAGIGMFDFAKGGAIIDAGYRRAAEVLEVAGDRLVGRAWG